MFGVFIIPAKTDNKAFKFNADGKKALKLDEAEFVQLVRTTPKMTYFVHHQDTYDSLPDDENIQQTKKYHDKDYCKNKKLRSPQNCFITEDEKYYIRVITKDKEWFKRHYSL